MKSNAVRLVSFELSDAQILLEQLRLAAQSDGASPRSFALLLRKASETSAWTAEFSSFRAYLSAREADGGLELNEQAFLRIAELGGVEKLARELRSTAKYRRSPIKAEIGVQQSFKTVPLN